MRNKKPLPTRRRRALGWVLALCLVVLANQALGLYCVTPGQALRQAERRYGLDSMEVWATLDLSREGDPERRRWLLSWNEDCLLLSTAQLDLRQGWKCQPVTLLQESGEALSAGEGGFCEETETGYKTVYLFFGSVRDPDIREVEVTAWHASLTETENGPQMMDYPCRQAQIPASEFVTVGDRRLFFAVLDPVTDPGGSTYPEYRVNGIRQDGTVVPAEKLAGGL